MKNIASKNRLIIAVTPLIEGDIVILATAVVVSVVLAVIDVAVPRSFYTCSFCRSWSWVAALDVML